MAFSPIHAQDQFTGSADTLLASHDSNYLNARASYAVSDLELDGSGGLRFTGATSSAGFSYSNSQPMAGQSSEACVLARDAADSYDDPYIRILVATVSDESAYYGWEFVNDDGTDYTRLTWFRGAPAINGRTNLDISSHGIALEEDHVFRSTLTYNSSSSLTVRAYVDNVEISSLTVVSESGSTDGAGDSNVPFYASDASRVPGMLTHGNLVSRSLLDSWGDGYSFAATPNADSTGENIALDGQADGLATANLSSAAHYTISIT